MAGKKKPTQTDINISLNLQDKINPMQASPQANFGTAPDPSTVANLPRMQSAPTQGSTVYQDEVVQRNDNRNVGLFSEQGVTGLTRFGGFVYEEFLKELQGKQGALTYREMRDNDPIIGALMYAIEMLIRNVRFTVQVAGTTDNDKKAAEFLETNLDDMSSSWSDFLSEVLTFLPFGWSYHEICYKYRKGLNQESGLLRSKYTDGKIGWRKLSVRAQETLWRWRFQLDGGILGMEQIAAPDFRLRFIPIEKALLFRVKSNKNGPEGRSLFRNAYQAWWYLKNMRNIEAIGVERDLVGLPMMWIPPESFDPDGSPAAKAQYAAMKKILINLKRNEQEGILFPSMFDDAGRPLFDLKLLSSSNTRRQFDTDKIIRRYEQRIAMTVMADFLMIGNEKAGSYALSVNKSSLFQTALGSILQNICDVMNTYAIPRLFNINSWEGLTDYPKLVHESIEKSNLTELGAFIKNLTDAGVLHPDDDKELENWARDKGDLPKRIDYMDTPEIPVDRTDASSSGKTGPSSKTKADYPDTGITKSAIAFDFKGLSDKSAGRIKSQINRLEKMYPVGIKKVSSAKLEDDTFACTETTDKTIEFNTVYFDVDTDVDKSIDLAVDVGWHPKIVKGEGLESIVSHEYGHVLYKSFIEGTKYEKEFDKIWNMLAKNPVDMSEATSIYGTKTSHEFFAEAFSIRMNGKKVNKYVVEVIDILERAVEGK